MIFTKLTGVKCKRSNLPPCMAIGILCPAKSGPWTFLVLINIILLVIKEKKGKSLHLNACVPAIS